MHGVYFIRGYINGLWLDGGIEKLVCMKLSFCIRYVRNFRAKNEEQVVKRTERWAYLRLAM